MNKKILIISLFVGILLIAPIITADNTNKNESNEVIKNPEAKPVDRFKEVITIIGAYGEEGTLHCSSSGLGVFFHRVVISLDEGYDNGIEIRGLRRFLIIPITFEISVRHVVAQHCLILFGGYGAGYEQLVAIALGNIEWS